MIGWSAMVHYFYLFFSFVPMMPLWLKILLIVLSWLFFLGLYALFTTSLTKPMEKKANLNNYQNLCHMARVTFLCRLPFWQRHIVLPFMKNLACFKICFWGFLCLKILHRTQIRWPKIFCLYVSFSLYISVRDLRS